MFRHHQKKCVLVFSVAIVAGAVCLAGSVPVFAAPTRPVTADTRQPLTIIENRQPKATIVLPKQATPHLQSVARRFQEYVRRATGATLPISSTSNTNGVLIHLGQDSYVQNHQLGIEKLDGDGFVLRGIDKNNFVIVGGSDWGTEYGVYEFLERYVGVRWLFPTDLGTHVPNLTELHIPLTEIRQEPAFYSRRLSPFYEADAPALEDGPTIDNHNNSRWARLNRMHSRIDFSHNLYRLFPPSKYAKTHPEFYPIVNGARVIPPNDNDENWQPNFSAPGIVEEAAENIKQYFRDRPHESSYSLGMNDSDNFDESPTSLARENGRNNFLGKRDVSDIYFEWANAVVTEVLKEFPDKYFGVLAYENLAEPPTRVKVHPHIIPFMTYDRHKWADPELARKEQELTRRWAAQTPRIGWYDYLYGWNL